MGGAASSSPVPLPSPQGVRHHHRVGYRGASPHPSMLGVGVLSGVFQGRRVWWWKGGRVCEGKGMRAGWGEGWALHGRSLRLEGGADIWIGGLGSQRVWSILYQACPGKNKTPN